MIDIDVNIDSLLNLENELNSVKARVSYWCDELRKETEVHIKEAADSRLKSRKDKFVKAVSSFQASENTWIIELDSSANWIEDGMDPHSMVDDLLKERAGKKIHTAKDGSRWTVVPFNHGSGGSTGQMNFAQRNLLNTIKSNLKIPLGVIQKDSAGKDKIGLVHKQNIMNSPIKTQGPFGGYSQGKGPVGQVMQGPTGTPFLQGLRIYQKPIEGKTHQFAMTFRIVSSKHKAQGRWEHPGLEPTHLFRDGGEWASNHWDKAILPVLFNEIEKLI